MIMFIYNTLAITNRHLCKIDFLDQIELLSQSDVEAIILREKDLSEDEYYTLAKDVIDICKRHNKKCILHSYVDVAKKLNCKSIHLPLNILRQQANNLSSFTLIGSSVHSIEEAIEAERLGANYITAGHVFKTACKKDLEPRGLSFIKDITSSVEIPVYGLGGINKDNASSVISEGCYGIAIMSEAMKLRI